MSSSLYDCHWKKVSFPSPNYLLTLPIVTIPFKSMFLYYDKTTYFLFTLWLYFKSLTTLEFGIHFLRSFSLYTHLHGAFFQYRERKWNIADIANPFSAESFIHFGQWYILESLNYYFSVHITMMYNKLYIKLNGCTYFLPLFIYFDH